MQGLYVLGVVTAAMAAGYSAFVVGMERRREQRHRRPTLFLVQPPDASTRSTALDRALEEEMRRRARGAGLRRHVN